MTQTIINTTEVNTLSGSFDIKHFKDDKGCIWYSADDILKMIGYAAPSKRVEALYNKSSAVYKVTPSYIVETPYNKQTIKRIYWNTRSLSYLKGILRDEKLARYDLVLEVIKQVGKVYNEARPTLKLNKQRMTQESVKQLCDNTLHLNKINTLEKDLDNQKQYSAFLCGVLKQIKESKQQDSVEDSSLVTTPLYPKGFTEVTWDLYLINRYKHKMNNAKERKIAFNLSFDDFRNMFSYHHCYYTGKEMIFQVADGGNLPSRYATIERIDSKGNYDKNNTVLCCKAINDFKSVFEGTDTPFKLKDIVRMADKMKQHIEF